jgi:alcohol dehydrogenase (cytochrome c)
MDGPALANVTATSGGVIFASDLKGTLYAVKEDVLRRHSLAGAAGGGMLTYAVNGKQYVAAMSGFVSGFLGVQGQPS